MSADAPDDSSIPILTERLTLPPLELDTTLPLEPQAPATSAPTVPLALDTSLPLNLALPQPPPPHLPPAAARAAMAPAPATLPGRTTPTAPAATVPPGRAAATSPAAATLPPTRSAVPAPAAATLPPTRSAMPAPAPVPAAPPVSPAEPGGSHWSRIELAMRSSILQAIADALPQHVDTIVRNRMNDAIDRLLTQLVAETRLAVAASLRDIVDQAVRAELARLRNQR